MEMGFTEKPSFLFLLWPGACLHTQRQFTTAICHGGAITSTTSSTAFTVTTSLTNTIMTLPTSASLTDITAEITY